MPPRAAKDPVSLRPRRVPRVGAILTLEPGEWRFGQVSIVLRVERARVDISRWYSSEWVWVEAMELDDAGGDIGPIQVLVCCDAIPEDAAEPTSG